ncbi:MAG: class I SAM-dependent methyltransferase [Chloroflexota bacterium]|nr:class I SAM-dependent methyltransferase [Chloroflexota bacterium]
MTFAYNLPLPFGNTKQVNLDGPYLDKLVALLSQDLDFHEQDSGYASHNFHSFPAKFPPQLPRKFIEGLTEVGSVILDPMIGSGTTIVEACLAGRYGVGFDIDPLALLVSKVKVTPLDPDEVARQGQVILRNATLAFKDRRDELEKALENRWDAKTQKFVNYWFVPETQIELLALITEIEQIEDEAIRAFFELVFSAIIITKSSGVSMAFDLAHTRPHRAKVVYTQSGDTILGHDLVDSTSSRVKFLTKTLRSPLEEFKKRFKQNLGGLYAEKIDAVRPQITFGDAQELPLDEGSVDLIVTSPPYAANAIDYMRAHKFSLVWLGYRIDDLGQKRGEYIGGEAVTGIDYEELPDEAAEVVADIASVDEKKGRVLHRYYSEMTRTLREMLRVLKPGRAAIAVVGSSTMRGKDTRTHICLADIGRAIGFEVPKIGVRHLDRNRRMMPAGSKIDSKSQIQQRMHKEYVIGFYKPKIDNSCLAGG